MQMQILRLLDDAENNPHLSLKQANPPVSLWINRRLWYRDPSELLRRQSSR